MKKRLTISVEAWIYASARLGEKNASKYIEGLLEKEILAEKQDGIYRRFVDELLKDEETLALIRGNSTHDVGYVPDSQAPSDW